MKYLAPLLIILALLLTSCDPEPYNQDESEIRDIVYDISRDFSWADINGIMEHVHPDYRHNGMYRDELRQLWQNRLGQFQLLSCEVSEVSITGDYATVHMAMTYDSATDTVTYQEPETYGDASYFYYDGYEWTLYGNQEY
jgi:hypothetical protein